MDGYDLVRNFSYGDIYREHRRSRPQAVGSVDGALRLTYFELDQYINRLVTALEAKGVGHGDHILWLGQNSAWITIALAAAAKLGAVLCPANWRMSPAETLAVIEDFSPRAIFWQEKGIAELRQPNLRPDLADRLWIQIDGLGDDSLEALAAGGTDQDLDRTISPDTALLAIYTAAFDGRPKAAMLSHAALLLQGILSAGNQSIDGQSVFLVSGPMFHLGVLAGTIGTIVRGGKTIYIPRIDPLEMLRIIDSEHPTHAFIPKPVVDRMAEANREGGFDISSLFDFPDLRDWYASSVMPKSAPRRRHPGGYGQTEICGFNTGMEHGSIGGRPGPLTQVRVLDERGDDVAEGEIGEIAVRGPLVMNGYHKRDAENARRTAHGWHRTNDLGRRHSDGSVSFVGPRTQMIKTGVENVYPEEVEACLRLHPAVAEACVIGIPDPEWDQNVKALIRLQADAVADAETLTAHCRHHIASYKKPKVYEFVDAVPHLADGSIDRAAADREHGGGGYPKFGK